MKRIIIYIWILLLALMAPVKRLDVAKLEPVDVVFVSKEDGKVKITTDTEAEGRGADAAAALYDLKQTTPGVVYLDTAEFLVVSKDAADQIDELRTWLKGSVKLCFAEKVEIEEVAKYLEVHGNLPKLRDWKTGDPVPLLTGKKIV